MENKAIRINKGFDAEIIDIPMPPKPGKGEALVRVL